MKRAAEILAERVAERLQATSKTWSNDAIAKAATEKSGITIGRSSVDRIRKAEANPTLENLEALAAFFGCTPWELLQPAGQEQGRKVSLTQAIKPVADAFSNLSQEKRKAMLGILAAYADAPESESASLVFLHNELSKAGRSSTANNEQIWESPGGKSNAA